MSATLTKADFERAKAEVEKDMELKGEDFFWWPQFILPRDYYDLLLVTPKSL